MPQRPFAKDSDPPTACEQTCPVGTRDESLRSIYLPVSTRKAKAYFADMISLVLAMEHALLGQTDLSGFQQPSFEYCTSWSFYVHCSRIFFVFLFLSE